MHQSLFPFSSNRLEPLVKKSFVAPALRPEADLSTLTLSVPVSNVGAG